jgi:hypothetical protein
MSAWLTRQELKEWSGRQQAAAIVRWLRREKLAYTLDADDWPKVARELRDRRAGLVVVAAAVHHAEPNFSALGAPLKRRAA